MRTGLCPGLPSCRPPLPGSGPRSSPCSLQAFSPTLPFAFLEIPFWYLSGISGGHGAPASQDHAPRIFPPTCLVGVCCESFLFGRPRESCCSADPPTPGYRNKRLRGERAAGGLRSGSGLRAQFARDREDRAGGGEAGGDNRRGRVSGHLGGTWVVLTVPTLPFRPGPVPTPHGPHGRRPAPGEQQQHGGHWLQLLPGLR